MTLHRWHELTQEQKALVVDRTNHLFLDPVLSEARIAAHAVLHAILANDWTTAVEKTGKLKTAIRRVRSLKERLA